jgi:hypothetical protein
MWRGESYLVVLGPLGGSVLERRLRSRVGEFELAALTAGTYVVRSGAIAHYGRVDTLLLSAAGRRVVAPLDPTPSHWCGFSGQVTVPPR